MPRIPNILFYCFGFDANFGGKPWSLVHYVCVRSAIDRLRPQAAFVYYDHEPKGIWWEETLKLVQAIKVRAPREIFGNPLAHAAHRADVVRLELLLRHGGIYLDADVLVHRSFDELLDHSVVLGEEGVDGEIGIANAVILAEPGAPFLQRWYEEYRWFRSVGRDQHWNEHSVRVPRILAQSNPREVTVLPYNAFYWPLWTAGQLEMIFAARAPVCEGSTFANHLWESRAWEDYLEHLTPGVVRRVDSNFHRWARPYVSNFSDSYGAPNIRDRARKVARIKFRKIKTMLRSVRSNLRLPMLSLGYRFAPSFVRNWHRRRVFRDIYKHGLWGSSKDSPYYSGIGSRGVAASSYSENIAFRLNSLAAELDRPITVVDLGCGDFEVGRELLTRVPALNYVGCDIVPELISHLSERNTNHCVQFKILDIVSEELPAGDVCLIRQVLQHLSNADIKCVLSKLGKYKKTFITEGYPVVPEGLVNPDKPVGFDVRFDWRTGRGRGVELDKEPFDVPTREICRVFASPQEVIVTFESLLSSTTVAL